MDKLDTALFCEIHNRMNDTYRRHEEKENAYSTLQNMMNMLHEYGRENRDLPIPLRGQRPSRNIEDRYGIPIDSEFRCIWVVLERLCNGKYILKQSEHAQPES